MSVTQVDGYRAAEQDGMVTDRPSVLLERHRERILLLARQHRAVQVWVFGSVARGVDTVDSDLDLLVRFAPEASLFDQSELADALAALLDVPVDIVSEGGLTDRHHEIRQQARELLGPGERL